MILPRIELGTFCVLSRCHNQLDHRTIAGGKYTSQNYTGITEPSFTETVISTFYFSLLNSLFGVYFTLHFVSPKYLIM